ncbi:hypothetical protein J2129_000360 [Methanofollis sp. W23]|uniref:zinc ribbon domain-containing protein n=1 Tax=Methanofollis sp. W23 TaxID=2817849 RepID=UPI001AE89AC0|nr:zinc ribbon domain-containing protein [Methanofollis sp. W23]MBP2144906.1 hypothetical protein [Methanofollis sp. W23]
MYPPDWPARAGIINISSDDGTEPMQICPDCHAQCSDDANYCGECLAKLPDARRWMVDSKKILEFPETERQKISEHSQTGLNDEKFKSRLFLAIFGQAVDRSIPLPRTSVT